jgi:signal transduction histidine kinase
LGGLRLNPVSSKNDFRAGRILLSAFRAVALAVAWGLFKVDEFRLAPGVIGWALIYLVSVYGIYKVLSPFRPYRHKWLNYADFFFDLVSCLALPFFTLGVSSPFLLYLYCPILTSALFLDKKYSILGAGLQFFAIFSSQIWTYHGNFEAAFTSNDHPLFIFIIYPIVAILMIVIPYLMSVNMADGIRTEAITAERKRLSRDVHDGLAQSLSVINWRLQLLWNSVVADEKMSALNHITELMKLASDSQKEARMVIDQLQAFPPAQGGLAANLTQQASDFTRNYGVKCELHMADGNLKLSSLAELQLLCVTQEALNNIRKHADATSVQVNLKSQGEHAVITISDNGRGFDKSQPASGHGLSIMAERVTSVGGQLALQSQPGTGTIIQIEFPTGKGKST